MSLSKPRIVHGRLGDATAYATRSRHAGAWDEATQAQYLEDVRARAEATARDILAQAMAEAERLREAAHAEGLAEGRAQAMAELEAERARLGQLTAALHEELRTQLQARQEAHDALARRLLILAVEKATGLLLAAERQEVLERLFHEAQERLRGDDTVTVRVHPEDVARMEDLLRGLPADRPVRVRPDPAMVLGGVRLETEGAVVDNTVDERLRQVLEVLQQLTAHD